MRQPMRTALLAMMLTIASQVSAECGKLCDDFWWDSPFSADLENEINAGADVLYYLLRDAGPLAGAVLL